MSQMMTLELPKDPELLAAAGAVALAHGHLEYVLSMTVKSITGGTIEDALRATAFKGAKRVREHILSLAEQHLADEVARSKLQDLLARVGKASVRRNALIHRPWAKDSDGNVVVKDDDHVWGPPPTAAEFRDAAAE